MGEFNLGERKRNAERNGRRGNDRKSNPCLRPSSKTDYEHAWSLQQTDAPASLIDNAAASQQTDDVKDVNFWTNVFFNSGSSPSTDLSKSMYPSTAVTSNGNNDRDALNAPVSTTSAILLNNIISNMKDNRSKVLVNAPNGSRTNESDGGGLELLTSSVEPTVSSTSSYAFVNAMKQHDLSTKRKSNAASIINGVVSSAKQRNAHNFYYQNDFGHEEDDVLNNGFSAESSSLLQVGIVHSSVISSVPPENL